jgi:rhodanese-related sulfurtransferase
MPRRVSAAEAAALLEQGWRYLDVRSIPEFEEGHPPGSANVPLLHAQGGRMVPNPDFQRVVEANYPRDTQLVVGCRSGGRSAQAAALLEAAGYPQVVDMGAGMAGERDMFGRVKSPGWIDSGLPVEKVAAPAQTYAELSRVPR